MIYRKDEFVQQDQDDKEFPIKQVDRLEPVPEGPPRFIGRAALNMNTPMGIQQIPVSFEIEAETIQDAFARYTELARPKLEEVKQHVQQRLRQLHAAEQDQIVRPGGSDGDRIIRLDDLKGRR
ncbi:MAG: hypothetical protein GXY85_10180 [Candidatus Brocadiaceae bacterium]|nr:hypothetical protein [Candidatus Brocadiaceae bacterium]